MPKPNENGKGGGGGGKSSTTTPPPGAIEGTEGNDLIDLTSSIAATLGDDAIWALGGNDEIDASDGNDTIEAGAGDDTINGGAGDDVINGGDGGDLILGSGGSDTIDGGGGIDAVVYYGTDADYDIVAITETKGGGKNQKTVIVGYEVYALDGSGDVDYISNVESVTVVELPPTGAITTQGDFDTVQFDGTVTLNVLENDYIEGGALGAGLTVTDILDIQLDIDGDGVNDNDLIPDTATFADFASGVELNDGGSILTVLADGTLTWNPNGQYDDASGTPVISFWYEASDGAGAFEYGDVTLQVTYPAPEGDVTFETMTRVVDPWLEFLGVITYADGPDGSYWVSQLTTATNSSELRDPTGADIDFDYDGGGDAEFRVWTDADGTTHEMNLKQADNIAFDLGGMTIEGFDAGETATFYFADVSGIIVGSVEVTSADLDANNLLEFTNATGVYQFSVEAGVGDEFYIDDVFFI